MPNWRTLAIYIARQFLVWCLGVFAAMIAIVFLLDYVELIRRSGNHPEATLIQMLELAALKQPYMAQQILPFVILFGGMMAFWRMTRSHELVIARAVGISVWQFVAPAVTMALLIGVISITVFNPIASVMELTFQRLENRVLREHTEEFVLSRSGMWLRQSDRQGMPSVIHAGRTAPGVMTFEDVMILLFDKSDKLIARIDANQAQLLDGRWKVTDGTRWEPEKPQQPFTETSVETNMTPSKIEDSFASPETMSFWELPSFIQLLSESGFSTQRHRLYYNALLARPFLLAAMVLIAATFSLRMQRRGGTTMMVAGGVASGFMLYLLSDVVFALGLSATIPVTLAAWTPAGISLLLAASLLLYLEDG